MMDYKILNEQLAAVSEGVKSDISILANASALIWENLDNLNWAGFYLLEDDTLYLGPFQGKVACVEIAKGRGVCGTCVQKGQTVLVPNVHEFPGHIACDCASNSEIVVPIHVNGKIYGVLDIDSPNLNRFTAEDKAGLEEFVRILSTYIKGSK